MKWTRLSLVYARRVRKVIGRRLGATFCREHVQQRACTEAGFPRLPRRRGRVARSTMTPVQALALEKECEKLALNAWLSAHFSRDRAGRLPQFGAPKLRGDNCVQN